MSVTQTHSEKTTQIINDATLARGGSARRKQLPPAWPKEYLEQAEAMSKARRAIDKIVAEQASDPAKTLVDLRNALVGLPEDVAAKVAGMAAAEFVSQGRWGYAREVYAFIVEAFPTLIESAEACRWLVRFHSSAEVRRRIELGHINPIPMAIFDSTSDSPIKTVSGTENDPQSIKPIYRFKNGTTARKWSQMAVDFEPTLASFGANIIRDPATRRCGMIARDMLGISVPKMDEPMKSITAIASPTKPTLDGKLDEACWADAAATAKLNDQTTVKYAFDEQFLYVGIVANILKGEKAEPEKVRSRDADLSKSDRVELTFDLTRGGDTPFRFAIDHRGRLAEDCWGDRSWNPKWFVAFEPGETQWTAEIAIPLSELTGNKINGQMWAINAKRCGRELGDSSLVPAYERCDLIFPKAK